MKHPLQEMMDKRRQGIRCGIPLLLQRQRAGH